MTKVSLIMTTYNCRDHFAKSIESAVLQDWEDMELVIVDGGSTDGTLELIQKYAEIYPDTGKKGKYIHWISEPDNGIYDGMNKGIQMATGDVIAVFNDLFCGHDAVTKLMQAMNEEKGCMGVHADLVYMDGTVCKRYWHMGQGNIHTGWMPAHPTLYLRKEIYETFGLYDIKYRSSADYEYMIRILKHKEVKLAYVPQVLISMFYGGTSNNGITGYPRNIYEAYLALVHNHVAFPITAILLRVLKTFRQYYNAAQYNQINRSF